MVLKSIEISGFKSFAKTTRIDFDAGVTAIVGPNGCGKSNVVDAIRWVLGESSARALRGVEMKDVIFNGSSARKPVNLAQVTLLLTECELALGTDYHEVAVTRRVFRDGKSEYLINNQAARLKDVQDLLSDTGMGSSAYSVMEQGKIDLLISAKPEDRRSVFEEAAGISKFKRERKEAQRKLEYTSINLQRVEDVLAEQKSRLDVLEKQVGDVEEFTQRAELLKTLDLGIMHREFLAREEKIHTQRGSKEKGQLQVATLESQVQALQVKAEELRRSQAETESRVLFLKQAEGEAKNACAAFQMRRKLNQDRIGELEKRKLDTTQESQRLNLKLEAIQSECEQLTDSAGGKKAKLERLEAEFQKLQQQLEQQQQELEEKKQQQQLLKQALHQAEADALTSQIQCKALDEKVAELDHWVQELTDKLELVKQSSGSELIDQLEESLEKVEHFLNEKSQELKQVIDQKDALDGRLVVEKGQLQLVSAKLREILESQSGAANKAKDLSDEEVFELFSQWLKVEEGCVVLEQENDQLFELFTGLNAEQQKLEIELARGQTEFEIRREARDAALQQWESLLHELEQKQQDLEEAKSQLEALKQAELDSAQRREQCSSDYSTAESEAESLEEEMRLCLHQKQEAKTSLETEKRTQSLSRESLLQEQANELSRRLGKLNAELAHAQQLITELTEENQQLLTEEQKEREAQVKAQHECELANENLDKKNEALAEEQRALAELSKKIGLVKATLNQEEIEAVKWQLKNEQAEAYCLERYQVELAQFHPDIEAMTQLVAVHFEDFKFDPSALSHWSALEERVQHLKQKFAEMGPVNGDAVAEYNQWEQKYSELKSQHDDLTESKSQLEQMIRSLTKESVKLFTEVFEQSAANFQQFFETLFGEGAEASLSLEDEGNPLESGINIQVKPPGKRQQSMKLLSGGERAMTAVALLFSIFKIKPAPFCVLDELDAPLDEANIGKFLHVLEGFSEKSQFIIVTHHKHTMQAADVIYGISMQEAGVSKSLSLRAADWDCDG